jgi:hypothetical protein
MERAEALTGFAVRPMIASSYEKAGRSWGNSLLPNCMASDRFVRRDGPRAGLDSGQWMRFKHRIVRRMPRAGLAYLNAETGRRLGGRLILHRIIWQAFSNCGAANVYGTPLKR